MKVIIHKPVYMHSEDSMAEKDRIKAEATIVHENVINYFLLGNGRVLNVQLENGNEHHYNVAFLENWEAVHDGMAERS